MGDIKPKRGKSFPLGVDRTKQVFTTGEVAAICHTAPRTVSKWFDEKQLEGYRIPGSHDRRIPRAALLRFLAKNGMTDFLQGMLLESSILLVGLPEKTQEWIRSEIASTRIIVVVPDLFSMGIQMTTVPSIIVIDGSVSSRNEVDRVVAKVAPLCKCLILLIPEDASPTDVYPSQVVVLQQPVDPDRLVKLIAEVEKQTSTTHGEAT